MDKNVREINPITATTLPDIGKIKNIMSQIGSADWEDIGCVVRSQINAQAQEENKIWPQVDNWGKIWREAGSPAWRDSLSPRSGAYGGLVLLRVSEFCGIAAYYTIKTALKLPYEHPVFDLIRLGVMVIRDPNTYKVFGKNGVFLGEFKL